jgi:hypothetical protein
MTLILYILNNKMWIVFNVYYNHQRTFTTTFENDDEMRAFCNEYVAENNKAYQQISSYYVGVNLDDLRFLAKIIIEMSDIIFREGKCDYVIECIVTGENLKEIN